MKKRSLRTISMLLAFLMLFMTGCGNGNTVGKNGSDSGGGDAGGSGDAQGSAGDTAMGRYVEDSQDLAEGVMRAADMVAMNDGSVVIQDYYNGQMVSKDQGETWENVHQPWLDELNSKGYISSMTLSPDGYAGVVYSPYGEDAAGMEDLYMSQEDGEQSDGPEQEESDGESGIEEESQDSMDFAFSWQYLIVSPDGTSTQLLADIGDVPGTLWFSDQGELFLAEKDNIIYQVDKTTGEVKEYLAVEEEPQRLFISGNHMLITMSAGLYLYDMTAGERKDDTVVNEFIKNNHGPLEYWNTDSVSFLPFQDKEGNVYMAFDKGLYRHVPGGTAIEQVIDGTLSTFGNPSVDLVNMVALDNNEFLTLFTGGTVVKHTYDPDMPTVPDKQLSVYSLKRNDVMQQAIVFFQAKHPDVYVRYTVGMEEGSSVTREDALKNLNTAIMAGTGPDLVLLDGMPIRSYIDKGVLADITSWVSGLEEKEELIPHVRDTFKTDQGLYGVPARFNVPLLVGNKDVIKDISDITTFADAMESLRKEKPKGSILEMYSEEQILHSLAYTCGAAWQNEDGSVNEQALKEFLTQAKRVYDAEMVGLTPEQIEEGKGGVGYGTSSGDRYEGLAYDLLVGGKGANFALGSLELLTGYMEDGFGMAVLSSVFEKMPEKELSVKGYAGQTDTIYKPDTIVGMLASSSQQELAGEFIQTLLSRENLDLSYQGLPINKAAFDNWFINTYNGEGGRDIGAIGFADENGMSMSLDVRWPEKEFISEFQEILLSPRIPDLTDTVLSEAVFEEGLAALTGEKDVDEVVQTIMSRLAIYMAE